MLPTVSYPHNSSVDFNQPSNPSTTVDNLTISVVVASGTVIITLLAVGISCIMALAGYRLWTKSRYSVIALCGLINYNYFDNRIASIQCYNNHSCIYIIEEL